jgi:hypothetical protein
MLLVITQLEFTPRDLDASNLIVRIFDTKIIRELILTRNEITILVLYNFIYQLQDHGMMEGETEQCLKAFKVRRRYMVGCAGSIIGKARSSSGVYGQKSLEPQVCRKINTQGGHGDISRQLLSHYKSGLFTCSSGMKADY